MEENENTSVEQQKEQEIERLRNTIAAFKEYDKKRKGYINNLLKQKDELTKKMEEERQKSASLLEKNKELQTIIQESKDAVRVQQYRIICKRYSQEIEILNKSDYDELVALTENHWEEIKKYDRIKNLKEKIKKQKETIDRLWSLLSLFRNEDGTLPGQKLIKIPNSLIRSVSESINGNKDNSDDVDAEKEYKVDDAIDEWMQNLDIKE